MIRTHTQSIPISFFKKIKDVLLQDTKTEVCNFVQNKINKKLISHNENQHKIKRSYVT